MRLRDEVLAYLESLRVAPPKTKDDMRRLMLARKLENLLRLRDELRRHEARAIALMKRVDYSHIRPRLVYVAPQDRPLWAYLRHVLSSAPWTGRPGRANFYFVVDEHSKGILGILDIGSDMNALGPRDRFIGWTRERKYGGGLNHVANVGTCVSVAPFGWLTGGKFQIRAAMSDTVRRMWHHRYGDILAAVVTTSLFGRSSIYNRVPGLYYIGETPGIGIYHIDEKGYRLLKAFIRANRLVHRTRGRSGNYGPRMETLQRVCEVLHYDIRRVSTHQPRGVYIALLGENAREFLRGEVAELRQEPLPEAEVADWWLHRWYAMRWPKKRDEISAFDFDSYRVDSQIELCRAAVEKGSETDNEHASVA